MRIKFLAVALCLLCMMDSWADPGPFDGTQFKGRIAWSADGNYNDPDDWAASPVALAIFAACGLRDKLVHFDYNCILPKTDPVWEREHAAAVLGAADRYGFKKDVFYDCQKDLAGAIENIKRAVNASSADNPLYYILAGPMEVPARGIEQADPEQRQFVYCISHNVWNDGYASGDLVKHNKRDVIPLGVKWVQIQDQNRRLITNPYGRPANSKEWEPYEWMRDSADPNVRFLMGCMIASTRADPSDAGMAYFMVTGDETADIVKLKALLEEKKKPVIIDPRTTIRLEAENFRELRGCQVVYKKDKAVSQHIHVSFSGKDGGAIVTRFDEPYTAHSALHDIAVRCEMLGEGPMFELLINGKVQGQQWGRNQPQGWQTHSIKNVTLATGDELTVRSFGGGPQGDFARLDYVELSLTAKR